jgi:hypothetical protein
MNIIPDGSMAVIDCWLQESIPKKTVNRDISNCGKEVRITGK